MGVLVGKPSRQVCPGYVRCGARQAVICCDGPDKLLRYSQPDRPLHGYRRRLQG